MNSILTKLFYPVISKFIPTDYDTKPTDVKTNLYKLFISEDNVKSLASILHYDTDRVNQLMREWEITPQLIDQDYWAWDISINLQYFNKLFIEYAREFKPFTYKAGKYPKAILSSDDLPGNEKSVEDLRSFDTKTSITVFGKQDRLSKFGNQGIIPIWQRSMNIRHFAPVEEGLGTHRELTTTPYGYDMSNIGKSSSYGEDFRDW